jgi:hypothetical protein
MGPFMIDKYNIILYPLERLVPGFVVEGVCGVSIVLVLNTLFPYLQQADFHHICFYLTFTFT